jgi:hypothetical protein
LTTPVRVSGPVPFSERMTWDEWKLMTERSPFVRSSVKRIREAVSTQHVKDVNGSRSCPRPYCARRPRARTGTHSSRRLEAEISPSRPGRRASRARLHHGLTASLGATSAPGRDDHRHRPPELRPPACAPGPSDASASSSPDRSPTLGRQHGPIGLLDRQKMTHLSHRAVLFRLCTPVERRRRRLVGELRHRYAAYGRLRAGLRTSSVAGR